ncbi:Ger(x)C family spore germination protein [Peptococcaceae bacterium 1198_IL3148]
MKRQINHKLAPKNGAATAGIKANNLLCAGLIVLMMLTQTACWDKVEVEQLAIVLAIALDKGEDGNIEVIVQTINPTGLTGGGGGGMGGGGGGGDGPAAYRNFADQGKTIFEAVRGMSSSIPRELYFSHNQVIIISEQLAREGVVDLMDFFDRNPQIRRNNWVIISSAQTDQSQLLEAANPLEISPAGRIVEIILEQDREPVYAPTQLGDFLEMLADTGMSAYTAGVDLALNRAVVPTKTGAEGGQVNPQDINLSGTAIFDKGRMVGWLGERETRGLLWVREGLQGGIYTFGLGGQENNVSLEIINSSSDMSPTVTAEGDIIFNINIKTEANVAESRVYVDYSEPENLIRIEQLLANEIKQDIEMALETAQQEHHVDVFGFGGAVYRHYPQYWKQISDQWYEILPNVEVVINVQTEIPRTGLVSKPIRPDVN